MFKKQSDNDLRLENAIADVLVQMSTTEPTSDEYAKLVIQLTKLNAIVSERKPAPVDKGVWITAGANLAGIAMIVGYERANVVTSKAITFVSKLL